MAKNKTMQQKNMKAKKLRQREISERNKMIMAHEPAPDGVAEYIPFIKTEFESITAIRRRIIRFMGKPYNVIRFQKRYPEIFLYISKHSVPETKREFKREFDLIMKGLL